MQFLPKQQTALILLSMQIFETSSPCGFREAS